MAQVVTPVPAGIQDQESKNWYKAQKYRQVIHQLELIREEIASDDREQFDHVNVALAELREVFNSLVPGDQRMGLKRALRRGG